MSATNDTAVLLFSRSARAEATSKAFGAGAAGAYRIADTLLRRTERTLAGCGLPVVRIDETRQRGGTFGERITAAVADAFRLGYRNLIVVGSDVPDLNRVHLRRARAALRRGRNYVIPDRRGGVALLALQSRSFAPASFARMAWETAGLLASIRENLPLLELAESLNDLNTLADIRRAWYLLRSRLGELGHLVFDSAEVANVPKLLAIRVVRCRGGRAPPRETVF